MRNREKPTFFKSRANNSSSRTSRGYGGGPRSTNYGYRLLTGYHGADTKRNVWDAVGYPDQVDFDMMFSLQARLGLAKAIIDLPVKYCWSQAPAIYDASDDESESELAQREPNEFEKAVSVLIKKHHLFRTLKGLDRRQRIGRYGGVVVVAKQEGSNLQPKDKLKAMGVDSVIKLAPVNEAQIDVSQSDVVDSFDDPMFGMPKFYNYRTNVPGSMNPYNNRDFQLHYTRVYTYGEGSDDGSIYGVPALECVLNKLFDWEKLGAAAAEGFWKNAKQRTTLNIQDGKTAGAFKNSDAITDAIDDFESGIDSMLLLAGTDAKTLQSALADPTGAANILLQDICSGAQIEKTLLIGFETGERSSQENMSGWLTKMNERRENECTDMTVGLLQHLVDINALPKPKNGIRIVWDDLLAATEEQKLGNASKMVEINERDFRSGGDGQVFTQEEVRGAAGYDEEAEKNDDREAGEPADEEGSE